jgi:hypothetical protein
MGCADTGAPTYLHTHPRPHTAAAPGSGVAPPSCHTSRPGAWAGGAQECCQQELHTHTHTDGDPGRSVVGLLVLAGAAHQQSWRSFSCSNGSLDNQHMSAEKGRPAATCQAPALGRQVGGDQVMVDQHPLDCLCLELNAASHLQM